MTRALRSSGAGLFAVPRVRTKMSESSYSYYAREEQITKGYEVYISIRVNMNNIFSFLCTFT